MTDDKIALRELLEKGSDATFLREMIGFAAQRLMELETETLCGAGHGERSAERTQPAQRLPRSRLADAGRHASSCAFRSCATAATSQASWNRGGWPRRR